MKRIAAILLTMTCCTIMANAQTFTEILQKKEPGKGEVTVVQSKEIEALVNGKINQGTTSKVGKTPSVETKQPEMVEKKTDVRPGGTVKKDSANKQEAARARTDSLNSASANRRDAWRREKETSEDAAARSRVDTSKKIMRNARKVTGYRVQVYTGGNTRADRERAQQAGSKMKAYFPDVPVYVHFYSPSWKCRIGNFRDYAEAERMLRQVRQLGFKQAVIVKGTISVY